MLACTECPFDKYTAANQQSHSKSSYKHIEEHISH